MSDSVVLFETIPSANGKKIAVATLNAEKSLNSLSLAMVDLLNPQLAQWENDASIACVILRGAGAKAFCAGGDVVQLYQSACAQDEAAATFFEREYRLDYQIHVYQKPLIVWGNGIVMGGGLGLMSGASHRIVTESSRIAMPEVTIGLYPDVGGTWFLNRTPGKTGLFLALTGASVNAADALFIGLADRFIAHEKYSAVIDALAATQWHSSIAKHAGQVSHVLREIERDNLPQLSASPVRTHFDLIGQLCDGDDIDAIVANILAWSGEDKWLQKAVKTLASGCPTTIHLVDQQFKRGKNLSLREAFQLELILSINCMRHDNFREGVRALLIDKDNQPKFVPPTLADVKEEFIAAHFAAPWGNASNPLSDL
ncbi:MAG TPA: enoyl-CoA hydratase/isomerase family protein [Spongiibacteraceae bacterium]|nr:enoyl-CoA hydratase/isomerase family protein [Spongiibacteraceae bacterium]